MSLDAIMSGTLITGAAIGLLAAFWSKLKALAWRLVSFFVVRIVVEDHAATALGVYLWKNFKKSRYGDRRFSGGSRFVKPVDRVIAVAWETIGNEAVVFWSRYRPLVASFALETQGHHHSGFKLTLTFVRGMFSADDLICEAMSQLNDKNHGTSKAKQLRRFEITHLSGESTIRQLNGRDTMGAVPAKVADNGEPNSGGGYRYLQWKDEEVGQPSPPDPLGPLAFPAEIDVVVEEARRWKKSEDWYKNRRVLWRMGWLIYGLPGTGKTSFAKAVAMDLDLHVYVLELATMNDVELMSYWKIAMSNTPCMILIEDIDAIFHGRDNVRKNSELSFSCLLNCISGVESADGAFLVVTTNHVEHIDPAMGVPDNTGVSSRPGRLDRAICMGPLNEDCRERVAKRILSDCQDEIADVVAAGNGETGAQFQDRCARIALARYWSMPTATMCACETK